MSSYYLHDTAKICCDKTFQNRGCNVRDWCAANDGVTVQQDNASNGGQDDGKGGVDFTIGGDKGKGNQDGTSSGGSNGGDNDGCCAKKWHLSTTARVELTCTNDDDYPSAWNLNAAQFLHGSSEACCEKFLKKKECNIIDVCGSDCSSNWRREQRRQR